MAKPSWFSLGGHGIMLTSLIIDVYRHFIYFFQLETSSFHEDPAIFLFQLFYLTE